MNKYSVLVVGCDKHKKLLDLFFKQYIKNWNDKSIPIYVSMENESYSFDGLNIFVTCFGESWTNRVKKTFETIRTKAVLLLLDDFIIESVVDHAELNKLAQLINTNDTIGHFALTTVPMKNESNNVYFAKYYQRYQFGRYKTTLQAGMWNREEFIFVSPPNQNAWAFENYANFRSYLSERKYYATIEKEQKPIEYNEGLFCIQGKLNLCELNRLKEKYHEDFNVEGMEDNGGVVIRDPCPLPRRIIRRIKILIVDVYYRLLVIAKK